MRHKSWKEIQVQFSNCEKLSKFKVIVDNESHLPSFGPNNEGIIKRDVAAIKVSIEKFYFSKKDIIKKTFEA